MADTESVGLLPAKADGDCLRKQTAIGQGAGSRTSGLDPADGKGEKTKQNKKGMAFLKKIHSHYKHHAACANAQYNMPIKKQKFRRPFSQLFFLTPNDQGDNYA